MASTRAVWGIDIGQCAFKALRVRAVGDRIEALAHEYIEHPKILSQPDADRPALVAKALEQFLSKHDVRQDRVVVGVPGQHTLSRFTKLPPVEEKKIPDIVRFEASQQIPFDMDEVVWDWQTFRTGEAGDLEVGIFAMRRELVAEHLQPFAKANIEPVVVQAAPLALYNALRYDGQLAEGATLLLDIGAQNTDLVVAEPTSLWTRNIPIGGNNFTEALLKTFKISFVKAESLKRTAASSKYARQIFQAMRPVFADLVAEIQRSMGFYSSTHRGTRITRVVGMGNAFKLPGLQKFLQSSLGLDVIRPSTFSKLSVASAQNAPQLIEHLLSFGVAYGLALQGLGLTQITSNLLPPEIAKAIIWRRKIPWFWGAAACLAFGAALMWGRYWWDSGALAAIRGSYAGSPPSFPIERCRELLRTPPPDNRPPMEYAAEIVGLAESLQREYRDLEQKSAADEENVKKLAFLQKDKAVWPRIWQEIDNALPPPPSELAKAMAAGPEGFRKAVEAAGGRLDRSERPIVFVRSLSVKYGKDTRELYEACRGSASGVLSPGPTNAPAAGTTPGGPGFVVRIEGRTPYKNGPRFIEDAFLKKLGEVKVQSKDPLGPNFHFEVDRRSLCWCDRASNRPAEPSGGGAPTGGFDAEVRSPGRLVEPMGGREPLAEPGFGVGAGGMGGSRAGMLEAAQQGRDPVTGEPIGNDWLFEIMFRVVLDQPVPAEGTSGGAAE